MINIKQEALDGIKAYLDDEERPTPKKGYEKALFLSSHKRRLGYTTLHRIIKEVGVKAGIKRRVYPHMFRASMLTFMDKNGASVFEIKAQSRHKQIKTVERYVRHSDEHNKEVYNKTMPEFNGKTQPEPTSNQDNPDIMKQLLDRIKSLEHQLKQNNNKTDYIQ
ncbi:MAG: site-specific integrase [Thermoplasmatales archaeon]|nr:site-specific integrase [Thermoplasmatales archaeon]